MSLSLPSYSNPATKRVALIYGCNPRKQSRYAGTDFAHIEVQIMRAADLSEDAAVGYRWTDWSNAKPTAFYVNNLTLRCQFDMRTDPDTDPNYLYGFHTRFMDTSYIDLETATAMTRTLRRAQTGIDKVDAQSGQAVEFARYVQAVMRTLGVEDYACYADDMMRGDLSDPRNFKTIDCFRDLYLVIKRIAADIAAS